MAEQPSRKKASGSALVALPATTRQAASNRSGDHFLGMAFAINPLRMTEIYKTMETTMTQNKAHYEKMTNDAAFAGKENVEALLKSTNIWMKGTEDILKTCMTMAQENAAKSSEAIKTLLSCKNLNELTEAQNRLVQESFDGFMTGATRLSELTVRLTTDALEPINDQVSRTIRKATDSVAA